MMALVALAASILALLAPGLAVAGDPEVEFSAVFRPDQARAEENVTLEVTARIPRGYYLYSMTRIPDGPLRLRIDVESEAIESASEWHAPRPEVEFDPAFRKHVEHFSGEVTHRRVFTVRGRPPPEGVPLAIRGQICTKGKCIPVRARIAAKLAFADGPARAERSAQPALEGEVFDEQRPPPVAAGPGGAGSPMDEGLLGFIIIAFLAGLAALATPCVFPMIPITVSFFSKYSRVSLRRAVTMALIYAVSIVATFTMVGIVVSAVFGAVGMQWLSSSGGFNIFMALMLVAFACNLFGLFEIRVPGALIAGASAREQSLTSDDGSLPRQALGVFLMGLVFTLVSFTCTVGFIGFVIAQAAGGQWFYPAVGMLAFSLAFALPFFFLAIFPSWADKLRGRGGDWMVAIKACLGFVILAVALKFLSNVDLVWQWGVVTRPLVLALWSAIFLAAGLFLLRIYALPHSDVEERTVGPLRLLFAVLALALGIYSMSGIRDTRSMGGWFDSSLPPAVYPGHEPAIEGAPAGAAPRWILDDIDQGMDLARSEDKALFIDFTGYTCSSCRYMESAVFPRPEVRSRLERMALVKAYTDGNQEVHSRQREYQVERFRTAALPFYVVLNPHDDTVLAAHPDKARDVPSFVAFLDGALAAFEAARPASAVDDPPASEAAAGLATTGPPVDLAFPGLRDNEPVALSSLRGRWVLLNFWASWCAPCKKELEEDFPRALAAAPHVALFTVAFDGDETKEQAVAFADEIGLWKHVVLQGGEDPEEAGLDEAFGASADLPITYLIHPAGHIAWKKKGAVHADELIGVLSATSPSP